MKHIIILFLFMSMTFAANSQSFNPAKNVVTVVVPNAPGGPADSAGRIFADYLNRQNITAIVQNRPGAGGVVGAAHVASQPGNSHLLMVGFKTPVIFAPITAADTVTYNENTFRPVGMIGTLDLALVVNPAQVQSTSTASFLNEYKLKQEKINFGTFAGLFESYVTQLFQIQGVKPNIAIYKSSAQLTTDLISGAVQVGLLDANSVKPLVNDKKLAMISDFKFPSDMQSWWGIYAAPDVSKEVVDFYSGHLLAMHADPEFQIKLKRAFNNPIPMSSADFLKFHQSEIDSVRRSALINKKSQ
jgi:tripartite-type tricarboxylate transporter receptor subunit TctC